MSPSETSTPEFEQSQELRKTFLAAPFQELNWCMAGTTTRHAVPRSLGLGATVKAALRHFGCEHLPVAFAYQRHTNRVRLVSRADVREGEGWLHASFEEVDGLVATTPMALAVVTADCVPLIFVEEEKRIIAAVHAGWRGTFGEIAVRAMESIRAQGGDPARTRVWIGPSIGGCCYEVSLELAAQFRSRFAHLVAFDGEFLHGRMLDLVQLNKLQLICFGVPPDHISTAGLCTRHHLDRFYSYRAEGSQAGRLVTVVARFE